MATGSSAYDRIDFGPNAGQLTRASRVAAGQRLYRLYVMDVDDDLFAPGSSAVEQARNTLTVLDLPSEELVEATTHIGLQNPVELKHFTDWAERLEWVDRETIREDYMDLAADWDNGAWDK